MYEDSFGYDENIPEEIREIFMWLCQDLASLSAMWDLYLGLFGNKEESAILYDTARYSFVVIEKALRASMVMAICRLNDPALQKKNKNLSIQRLANNFQDNPEIQRLCTELEEACKPFGVYRNKLFAHRDLDTVLNYQENLLPKIEKTHIEKVLEVLVKIVNVGVRQYADSEFGFTIKMIGGADSLLYYLKKGFNCQKADLDKLKIMVSENSRTEIQTILISIKALAKEYKELTGKPLGVTGEVAEFSAAQILDLEFSDARQPGYDATKVENGKEIKYQIKSRCLKGGKPGVGRLGAIRLSHEWDFALLVLLDEDLEVTSIYEAERSEVKQALDVPGSKARNERGQLSISQFITISREIWNRESGFVS